MGGCKFSWLWFPNISKRLIEYDFLFDVEIKKYTVEPTTHKQGFLTYSINSNEN